jgi:hypothetical protein
MNARRYHPQKDGQLQNPIFSQILFRLTKYSIGMAQDGMPKIWQRW